MTNINLLHVSAPGCHPQGVFQIKALQAQHTNLGTHRPHWGDGNIKIVKYTKLIKITMNLIHQLMHFCIQ